MIILLLLMLLNTTSLYGMENNPNNNNANCSGNEKYIYLHCPEFFYVGKCRTRTKIEDRFGKLPMNTIFVQTGSDYALPIPYEKLRGYKDGETIYLPTSKEKMQKFIIKQNNPIFQSKVAFSKKIDNLQPFHELIEEK